MTTLKNSIALLVFLLSLVACNEEPIEIQSQNEAQKFSAHATLHKSGGYVTSIGSDHTTLGMSLKGAGYALKLNDFVIENSHEETYGENMQNFTIENGSFMLKNINGEELFGFYTGNGSNINGNVSINERWTVTGGTGQFLNATGSFSTTATGIEFEPLSVRITGTLYLKPISSNL